MNTLPKTAAVITICLTILQSCIISTIAGEIDITAMAEYDFHKYHETRGMEYKVTIRILNNAENTILKIDTLKLCNIILTDSISRIPYKSHFKLNDGTISLPYNSDTAISSGMIAIQELEPWNPAEGAPFYSMKSYAKIHGTIYTDNYNSNTLYTGIMYYPISGCITEHNCTAISINLYPNCPLYAEFNGKMEKILQPIAFSITVTDWQ